MTKEVANDIRENLADYKRIVEMLDEAIETTEQ
jgi:hypothetical protein